MTRTNGLSKKFVSFCLNSDNYKDTRLIGSYLNSKACVKRTLSKRPTIGFQCQLLQNAGQKYCRMPQGEHSAMFSTFNKLPLSFTNRSFLSILGWPFYTGFTVVFTTLILGVDVSDVTQLTKLSRPRISVQSIYLPRITHPFRV